MKKRLIAKLMVTALLITSMPVTAFAKETTDDVIYDVGGGRACFN